MKKSKSENACLFTKENSTQNNTTFAANDKGQLCIPEKPANELDFKNPMEKDADKNWDNQGENIGGMPAVPAAPGGVGATQAQH